MLFFKCCFELRKIVVVAFHTFISGKCHKEYHQIKHRPSRSTIDIRITHFVIATEIAPSRAEYY